MIHRGPSEAGDVGILAAKGCECNAQRQNPIPWAAEGHQKDLRRESNGKTDASKGQMWLQPGLEGRGEGGCPRRLSALRDRAQSQGEAGAGPEGGCRQGERRGVREADEKRAR